MTENAAADKTRAPTAIPRWLPNAISIVRILLIPVWGLCAELCRSAVIDGRDYEAEFYRYFCLVILITIGVSDVVDGYLARRFGLASNLGAALDAIADKLAQVSLLLFFTLRGAPAFPMTPLWFLILILVRDVVLAAGYTVVNRRRGRVEVHHRFHGKASSLLFFALLVLLTADISPKIYVPLVWTIAAIVVLSTADYARFGARQLRSSGD